MFARLAAVFCVCAFVLPAWACFAPSDAKPKHEISVMDLRQPVAGIVVTYESEGYLLRVEPGDLLSELSDRHMDVVTPNDLSNALRSKMLLGQDISTQELVDVLIANANAHAPGASTSGPSWIPTQASIKFRFVFANLLQEGKVSVTEISSKRELPQLKLDRFNEVCHGGRLFTTLEDKEILRIVDWIS